MYIDLCNEEFMPCKPTTISHVCCGQIAPDDTVSSCHKLCHMLFCFSLSITPMHKYHGQQMSTTILDFVYSRLSHKSKCRCDCSLCFCHCNYISNDKLSKLSLSQSSCSIIKARYFPYKFIGTKNN